MRNRNIVQDLKNTIVNGILSFMNENKLYQIEFKNSFRIYIEEETFNDDYIRVPYAATLLSKSGTVFALGEPDHTEIDITSLDIYEVAYILDALEAGEYNIEEKDDEDFIDPAGGRGLQSHI